MLSVGSRNGSWKELRIDVKGRGRGLVGGVMGMEVGKELERDICWKGLLRLGREEWQRNRKGNGRRTVGSKVKEKPERIWTVRGE
jgi:hypothetical protein